MTMRFPVCLALAAVSASFASVADAQEGAPRTAAVEGVVARPSPEPPHVPTVSVYLAADPQVTLDAIDPRGGAHVVCRPPCEAALPLTPSYSIGGDGVLRSRPFSLSGADGERVTLHVTSVGSGAHFEKSAVILVGGLATLGGLMTGVLAGLLYGANQYGANDSPNGVAGNNDPAAGKAALVGFGVAGVGAVVVLFGALMPDATKVKQTVLGVPPPAVPRPPVLTSLQTEPSRFALPSPTTLTVFSSSF